MDREAFLAGSIAAYEFSRYNSFLLVGEPTGSGKASFGYVQSFTLPYNKAICYYSTHYYEQYKVLDTENILASIKDTKYYKEWESIVFPDVCVSQTIEAYKKGEDNILNWILAQ